MVSERGIGAERVGVLRSTHFGRVYPVVPWLGAAAIVFGILGLFHNLSLPEDYDIVAATSPITGMLIIAGGIAFASYRPLVRTPGWRKLLAVTGALVCLAREMTPLLPWAPPDLWSNMDFFGWHSHGQFSVESGLILLSVFFSGFMRQILPRLGVFALLMAMCTLLTVLLQMIYGAREIGVDVSPLSFMGFFCLVLAASGIYLRKPAFRVLISRSWVGHQTRLLLLAGIVIPISFAALYLHVIDLPAGSAYYASYMVTAIVLFYVTTVFAVSARHEEADRARCRAEKRIEEASCTDPLTGAANRLGMANALAGAWKGFQEGGVSTGVILMDLDHFKRINDTLGHAAGDELLQDVCARVRPVLRPGDILGRWGGEEFLILISMGDRTDLVHIAERLRMAVEAQELRVDTSVQRIPITASFGVSSFRTGDTSFEAAIERADVCLYAAKDAGRNRISLDVAA